VMEVIERFPSDFIQPVDNSGVSVGVWGTLSDTVNKTSAPFHYGQSKRAQGIPYIEGSYIDVWGVPWEVGEEGIMGEVKHPPIIDSQSLESYTLPWEILEQANWQDVNKFCAESDKFVLTPWGINPFERMQFLRGSERLYLDLGYRSPDLLRLRDLVHKFSLSEIEQWCKTDVDGIKFADDWGCQRSLLISPTLWRELFKPLYAEYCQMIHSAGKFVFFHSDGNIAPIIPDLIEIGIDALNAQLFCMDIEDLGRRYKGRITFWGEIDRQHIMPFGQPEDVRQAVLRVRRALDTGNGGVIAQFEWGKDVPRPNVEAAFDAWLEEL
jgi:uroporphyrinogen decarboxylase